MTNDMLLEELRITNYELRIVNFSFIFFCCLFFASCKKNESPSLLIFSDKFSVELCDSKTASEIISIDTMGKFFDYVTDVDMQLQMKNYFPETELKNNFFEKNFANEKFFHEKKINFYKNFLKNICENFSEKEKNNLQNIFSELFFLCEQRGIKTLPKKIKIIKTKAAPYGENTFYTRNDAIVVTEKSLTLDREFLLKTFLHELSHILLRYNPDLKQKLFSVIGFEKIEGQDVKTLPNFPNAITNPDAVGFNQFWRVPKQFKIPYNYLTFYLYADTVAAKKESVEYFQFLKTGAFALSEEEKTKKIFNYTKADSIDLKTLNAYFGTDYLLQPDEIIAVYFSKWVYGFKKPESLGGASPCVNEVGKIMAQLN